MKYIEEKKRTVLIKKNKNFCKVLDSKNIHRRFKISTFATKTKIGPFGTHSPLTWIEGWNRLTLNLESFTKTVYDTNFLECRRITVLFKNITEEKTIFLSILIDSCELSYSTCIFC